MKNILILLLLVVLSAGLLSSERIIRLNTHTNTIGMEFIRIGDGNILFSKWPTRVKDFRKFVDETGYNAIGGMATLKSDWWQQRGTTWKDPGFKQGPDYPIVGVTWHDANAFCDWLTRKEEKTGKLLLGQKYRLPTDLEWSRAVGLEHEDGTSPADRHMKIKGIYPWGTEWPPPDSATNCAGREILRDGNWPEPWKDKPIKKHDDRYARTSPVGSFKPNKYGLYDMSGNVWEWCDDIFDKTKNTLVLRGGCWDDFQSEALLSSYRHNSPANTRTGSVGFRCVLDLSIPEGPVIASSEQENQHRAIYAFDKDMATRWSSIFKDNEWIMFDLGEEKEIAGVQIYWETAYGKEYKIFGSKDDKNWELLKHTQYGEGGIEVNKFDKTSKVRYIKIELIKRATQWGFSIWECRFLSPEELKETKSGSRTLYNIPFEFPIKTYKQQIDIIFKNKESADEAVLEITPLYNNYVWAISSRWDDNNDNDLKMCDVLPQYGYKATWYLNRHDGSFVSTAKKLLVNNNSIGGHSLTHPYLSYVNRNKIFEETAGIRIYLESALDTLINSYAFSFCNYCNLLEGNISQVDITHALERAGFYHIPNHYFHSNLSTEMIISPIMPGDGADIDGFANNALNDKGFHKRHPNLSFSMHVWYRDENQWNRFKSQLEKYGNNPDWWYCNQNQYAAYRYQYSHSKIRVSKQKKNILQVELERPVLLQVNDPTPLTIRIKNVQRNKIKTIKCETAKCSASKRKNNDFVFNVYHNNEQKLPEKIGLIANNDNHKILQENDNDKDFPGIKALLSFDDEKLELLLENKSDYALNDVNITYRLPLCWKEGVKSEKAGNIETDAIKKFSFSPTRIKKSYKYNAGNYFFTAQIDFIQSQKAGRIFTACNVSNSDKDFSYPQGNFFKLGPLSENEFNIEKFITAVKKSNIKLNRLLSQSLECSGYTYDWVLDKEDNPFNSRLDVEVIRTAGDFYNKQDKVYLLQTILYSEKNQNVKLICDLNSIKYIIANGQVYNNLANTPIQLNKGNNRLVLIYFNHTDYGFHPENAGCFLRFVEPDTEKRLTNIRFRPEKIKPDKKSTFVLKKLFITPKRKGDSSHD
ncbi:MAG: SUMF1/EgtB/PvdO family nonheme iron enzyme [Elusimicrobia bacterium]|nr:SUMF1/EgtB/PvdO family nonheme iron enzyme [Elusimicrobiota bacterium]